MPASFFAKLFQDHSKIGVPGVLHVPDEKSPDISNNSRTVLEGTPTRKTDVPGVPAAVLLQSEPVEFGAEIENKRVKLPAMAAELRRDQYEERAAILECNGNNSRAEAERLARAELGMTDFEPA
jgi:hypothetical protein